MAKNRKAKGKTAKRTVSPEGRQPAVSAPASETEPAISADLPSQHSSHLSPSSHPSLSSPDSQSSQTDPPPRIRKTRDDLLDWLEDAIYAPPGEITKDSAFVQEFTQETTTGEDGSETTLLHVKVVNRLTAARLLCQVNGWINSRARTSEPKDKLKDHYADELDALRSDPNDYEYDHEAEMAAERAYDESRIARGLPPMHAQPPADAQNQGEVASSNHDSNGEDCEHCDEEAGAACKCENESVGGNDEFQQTEREAATAVVAEAKSHSETKPAPTPESESESEPEYDESGCRVDKDGKVWVTMQSIREVAWASKRERERRRRRQSQGHKYEITHRREFSNSGFK